MTLIPFVNVYIASLGRTLNVCMPCIEGTHMSYGVNHQKFKDSEDAYGRCGCKNVTVEGGNAKCMCNPHSPELVKVIDNFRAALKKGRMLAQSHMEELGESIDASDFIGDNLCSTYCQEVVRKVVNIISEEQGWK